MMTADSFAVRTAMPLIFPGMDPYLENPAIFPGIHKPMVVYLADRLAARIRPRYVASVCERVYMESSVSGSNQYAIIPDAWVRRSSSARFDDDGGGLAVATAVSDEPVLVEELDLEIHQPYVEILDRESNMRVVTVIELISPSNKYAGAGRDAYVQKQQNVLASDTHLVEIDLLRRGPHVLAVNEAGVKGKYDCDYLVCVHRARSRQFEIYPRLVRHPLPNVRLPLAGDDPDVTLDIRAALQQAYEAGSYRERIDYAKPCLPSLAEPDQKWANEIISASSSAQPAVTPETAP